MKKYAVFILIQIKNLLINIKTANLMTLIINEFFRVKYVSIKQIPFDYIA